VLRQSDCARVLDGARILIVEDDYIISAELNSILAAAGAEVLGPCRNVSEAQKAIGANRPSGAVLDFRLGRETTLPVARRLQECGVPFLFFTGQVNTNRIRAECPDAKIIPKPFQRRTIVAAVADILGGAKKS
jgi:DNA-binding response OmpR family regulator